MKPATSLFDLFNRAKTDKRYKDLIILAYSEYTGASNANFGLAKAWIGLWVKTRIQPKGTQLTCERMVDYINDLISRIEPIEPLPELPPIVVGIT